MPDKSVELTRFEKMERSLKNVPVIAFIMHLSTGTKALAVLIAAILLITATYKDLFNPPTPPTPVFVKPGAIKHPPPIEYAKYDEITSKGRTSDSTDATSPPDKPGPPHKSTLANRLNIEAPSPGNAVGPRWTFVARGRSESGYLYPYVIDEAGGGRFVGAALRPIGKDSWLGNAPIGNNETKSGASYSVSVVWSKEPILTARNGALPQDAAIISNLVTVTRR